MSKIDDVTENEASKHDLRFIENVKLQVEKLEAAVIAGQASTTYVNQFSENIKHASSMYLLGKYLETH